MQVSVEITSGLGRRLTIGVPAERVEAEIAARLAKAAKQVRLKGFRQGKVPMNVIRQRFGAGVRQEVLGEVMTQSFYEAVRQEDLRPAGQPTIEPRSMASGRDIEFTASFEVYPEIELVDFARLGIQRPLAEVQEPDVDRMIEVLRVQQSTWGGVERAAQSGDRVNIDFTGRQQGEAFEGGSATGVELVLGSNRMVPGFESGIEGLSAGETRNVVLRMPEEYHNEALRGVEVEFEIRVNSVAEKRLPELDEAFFTRYGVSEGGAEAFRAEVLANMQRELRQALRNKTKTRVLDALLGRTEVEVPQALVRQEIDNLRQQALRQFGANAAKLDPKMLPDEMFQAQAVRRVSLGLLLGEVIRKEGLKADPARVRALVEETASTYEQPQEVIDWYYSNKEQLAGIEAAALEDQVIDLILTKANVSDSACTYEEALCADPPRASAGT